MTASITTNPVTEIGLSVAQLRAAEKATGPELDGGGTVIAEAFNQLAILWDGTAVNGYDDDDLLFLARSVADAGMRLRREALALGILEERDGGPGFYVDPGEALYDAHCAAWACRKKLNESEGGS